MIQRSTWLHLRIPFSFFLLPVFLFALSISAQVHGQKALLTFFILHFLLYPASNGYNSYFDKDEESIGGLEKPPPVSKELYYVALLLDVIAIALGLLISLEFAVMLLIYGLVSKAYSHPDIRIKKYAFTGWFIAGLFQGFFTFIIVYIGINSMALEGAFQWEVLIAAGLTTVLLWGSYPMTQIYQHKEDGKRGDETLSRKLGISGTFYFTAILFLIANVGFILYYLIFYSLWHVLLFECFLLPILAYFFYWFLKVKKDAAKADFHHTMRLNMISAVCLNVFFICIGFFS